MAIIRWNPFSLTSLLDQDEWEVPTFPGVSRLAQGLNLYETKDSLVAEVALPGVKEDEVEVTVDKGVVRVSAQTEGKTEEKDERKYFMSSMASSYNYSFRLPEGVIKDEDPQAHLEDGVLRLSFNKVEPVAPKKIKVVSTKKSEAK